MVRYKATIAYDGTNFQGFQRQPNGRTVQEEIEKTLTRMNNGQAVQIHGSGRTDAGVHALGQVIHFDFDERPLEKMRFGLDTQTPEDIAVKQVEIVDEHFHARYLVREKTYQFRVDIGKPRSPFRRYYRGRSVPSSSHRNSLDFNDRLFLLNHSISPESRTKTNKTMEDPEDGILDVWTLFFE